MTVTNHVLRAHEELLAVYERLGMTEYIEKERSRIAIIRAAHAQPIQLTIQFE